MVADESAREILAMERAALDRWGSGDPDGFLEIVDVDVTYFDPYQPSRIDGLSALRQYYAGLRGKIRIDSYEIVEPRVQVYGETAVLTFRFHSRGSESEMHWNATEVYRRGADGWRIVHSHWSLSRLQCAG